jgi:DNA-binding response OmpR family regulator
VIDACGGEAALKAAERELIEKPFTSTELLGRVRAVLGRRALSAAS